MGGMMLTAELKVNGCLIGHVCIVNTEDPYNHLDCKDNVWGYEYGVVEFASKTGKKRGKVRHNRDDGAFVLLKKVLQKLY